MVQKYQNEIPPIFYYGISTKTSEKDLKIPNLQALTLGRIIKMTLYILLWNDVERTEIIFNCSEDIFASQMFDSHNKQEHKYDACY